MQSSRWWRPTLAFLITFGLMAILGSLLRVVVVYRHFAAHGMAPDDPNVAADATRELAQLDRLYTPMFLVVACGVSLLSAVVFALWRPRPRVDVPPPLPAETR